MCNIECIVGPSCPIQMYVQFEGDTVLSVHPQLHTDIHQQFQVGSDTFVDKTLHGALKTAEECITKAITLSDDSTGVSS